MPERTPIHVFTPASLADVCPDALNHQLCRLHNEGIKHLEQAVCDQKQEYQHQTNYFHDVLLLDPIL